MKNERKDASREVGAGRIAYQLSASSLDEVENLARKTHVNWSSRRLSPPLLFSVMQVTPKTICFVICVERHTGSAIAPLLEYIRIGRVVRENNYFLLSDHSAIRRAANGTIQQAVDERYGNSISTPPPSYVIPHFPAVLTPPLIYVTPLRTRIIYILAAPSAGRIPTRANK
jgi:hypothetical protein